MAQQQPPPSGADARSQASGLTYDDYKAQSDIEPLIPGQDPRVIKWSQHPDQPTLHPRAAGSVAPGRSVGAGSAIWSDAEAPPHQSARPPPPRPARPARPYVNTHQIGPPPPQVLRSPSYPASQPRSQPSRPPSRQPSPQSRRAPPVPYLAQTPQHQPEVSRDTLPRSPPFNHPPTSFPRAPRSEREAVDAYLSQSLELPLDMLMETVAPDEVLAEDHGGAGVGRMGSMLGGARRTRSTVNLRDNTSALTQALPSPPPDRPRVMSHSTPGTPRRQSLQSLRRGSEGNILPKVVASVRSAHAQGAEARLPAARSPTPSHDESKCSSMPSSDEHASGRADAVYPYPSQSVGGSMRPELNPTSPAIGSMQHTPSLQITNPTPPPRVVNQDTLSPAQLARRTTSKSPPINSPLPNGRVEVLASHEATSPRSTGHGIPVTLGHQSASHTDRRPPLPKSASVDGTAVASRPPLLRHATVPSHLRTRSRNSSSASDSAEEDVATFDAQPRRRVDDTDADKDDIDDKDAEDELTFTIPSGRRDGRKLRVSLAWLTGRNRGTRSQTSSQASPVRRSTAPASAAPETRRASLQTPSAPPAPRHRRSQSLTEARERPSRTLPQRGPYLEVPVTGERRSSFSGAAGMPMASVAGDRRSASFAGYGNTSPVPVYGGMGQGTHAAGSAQHAPLSPNMGMGGMQHAYAPGQGYANPLMQQPAMGRAGWAYGGTTGGRPLSNGGHAMRLPSVQLGTGPTRPVRDAGRVAAPAPAQSAPIRFLKLFGLGKSNTPNTHPQQPMTRPAQAGPSRTQPTPNTHGRMGMGTGMGGMGAQAGMGGLGTRAGMGGSPGRMGGGAMGMGGMGARMGMGMGMGMGPDPERERRKLADRQRRKQRRDEEESRRRSAAAAANTTAQGKSKSKSKTKDRRSK